MIIDKILAIDKQLHQIISACSPVGPLGFVILRYSKITILYHNY